jgi:hypothetical protein
VTSKTNGGFLAFSFSYFLITSDFHQTAFSVKHKCYPVILYGYMGMTEH